MGQGPARDATLALVVDLDREAGLPDEAAVLRDAIHEFFSQRAQAYRRRLRELLRVGRTSLVIGLVALASAIALGDFLAGLMKGSRIGEIVRESFTIGGWVSMWRPLEIFLYDWWPIRDEARLSDRLAAMPVRIAERSGMLVYVKFDPRFDNLRADSRFDELLRRMNFPPLSTGGVR